MRPPLPPCPRRLSRPNSEGEPPRIALMLELIIELVLAGIGMAWDGLFGYHNDQPQRSDP